MSTTTTIELRFVILWSGIYSETSIIRRTRISAVLRPKFSTLNLYELQVDLYYLKVHHYYPRTSIIRDFEAQNLVRSSTADNGCLTVYTCRNKGCLF